MVEYDDYDDKDPVSCCRKCLEYGFQVPLKNRICPKRQPILLDNENWLHCHQCGETFPIYEKIQEASIKDF